MKRRLSKINYELKILKKSPRIILLLSLSFCVAFLSCQKEEKEPELVPITTSGKNTMGFYLDGEPINIEGEYDGGWWCPCGVDYSLFEHYNCEIFGSPDNQKYPISSLTISVVIDSVNPVKTYHLNENVLGNASIIDNSTLGGDEYKTTGSSNGVIDILRFDKDIISGTFNFEAENESTGNVIKITEGRFDIKRN